MTLSSTAYIDPSPTWKKPGALWESENPLFLWVVGHRSGSWSTSPYRPRYVRMWLCRSKHRSLWAPKVTHVAYFLFTIYTTDFMYCHLWRFSKDSAIIMILTVRSYGFADWGHRIHLKTLVGTGKHSSYTSKNVWNAHLNGELIQMPRCSPEQYTGLVWEHKCTSYAPLIQWRWCADVQYQYFICALMWTQSFSQATAMFSLWLFTYSLCLVIFLLMSNVVALSLLLP